MIEIEIIKIILCNSTYNSVPIFSLVCPCHQMKKKPVNLRKSSESFSTRICWNLKETLVLEAWITFLWKKRVIKEHLCADISFGTYTTFYTLYTWAASFSKERFAAILNAYLCSFGWFHCNQPHIDSWKLR